MFSNQQMRFFDRAVTTASLSDFSRFHLGCVAVLKNKIIASSPNKMKTHPTQAEYDKYRNFNCVSDVKNMHSLHAEIACLSMIKKDIDFRDLELYIARIRKDGVLGMARPCPACFNYMKKLGVRMIYFTTNYGYASEMIV